jgi:ribosome-associated toxin RatA of RatAB toxin-antitoxin module
MHSALRRSLTAGSLFVALALVPGAAIADAPTAASVPAKGEVQISVVSVPGSKTSKVVARAIIQQPPRKVWAVVSDCAHYVGRLPRVTKARLVSKVGNKHTCQVTISMPFPFSDLTAVTEATHEESENGMSRTWKLVSGDYTVNNGSWEVRPLDATGTSSIVTYSVQAEPTTPLPEVVRSQAQKKALPELIDRVRAEAAKIP